MSRVDGVYCLVLGLPKRSHFTIEAKMRIYREFFQQCVCLKYGTKGGKYCPRCTYGKDDIRE